MQQGDWVTISQCVSKSSDKTWMQRLAKSLLDTPYCYRVDKREGKYYFQPDLASLAITARKNGMSPTKFVEDYTKKASHRAQQQSCEIVPAFIGLEEVIIDDEFAIPDPLAIQERQNQNAEMYFLLFILLVALGWGILMIITFAFV